MQKEETKADEESQYQYTVSEDRYVYADVQSPKDRLKKRFDGLTLGEKEEQLAYFGSSFSGVMLLGSGAFGFTVMQYAMGTTDYRAVASDTCVVEKHFEDGNDIAATRRVALLMSKFQMHDEFPLIPSYRVPDDTPSRPRQRDEFETKFNIKWRNDRMMDETTPAWVLAMYANFVSHMLVDEDMKVVSMPPCHGLELRGEEVVLRTKERLSFHDPYLLMNYMSQPEWLRCVDDHNYMRQSDSHKYVVSKEKLLRDMQIICSAFRWEGLQHMDLHLDNIMVYQPPVRQFGRRSGDNIYNRFHPNAPFIFLPIDFGLMMELGNRVKVYNKYLCCEHLPSDGMVGECCDRTALTKLGESLGVQLLSENDLGALELEQLVLEVKEKNEPFERDLVQKVSGSLLCWCCRYVVIDMTLLPLLVLQACELESQYDKSVGIDVSSISPRVLKL